MKEKVAAGPICTLKKPDFRSGVCCCISAEFLDFQFAGAYLCRCLVAYTPDLHMNNTQSVSGACCVPASLVLHGSSRWTSRMLAGPSDFVQTSSP